MLCYCSIYIYIFSHFSLLGFYTKNLYSFLISSMFATCPSHFTPLDLITLIASYEAPQNIPYHYDEGFQPPRPTFSLEGHPLLAVRDCLFNIFRAIFRIRNLSPGDVSCHEMKRPSEIFNFQKGIILTHWETM